MAQYGANQLHLDELQEIIVKQALTACIRYPHLKADCGLEPSFFAGSARGDVERKLFEAISQPGVHIDEAYGCDVEDLAVAARVAPEVIEQLPAMPGSTLQAEQFLRRARQLVVFKEARRQVEQLLLQSHKGLDPFALGAGFLDRFQDAIDRLREDETELRPKTFEDLKQSYVETVTSDQTAAEGLGFAALTQVNYHTRGIRAGQLGVIAARPGLGKSTMAVQVARYHNQRGVQGIYLSGEMSDFDIGERLVYQDLNQPLSALLDTHQLHQALSEDLGKLDKVWFYDIPRLRLEDIKRVLRIGAAEGAAYFVIDNLGNIDLNVAHETEYTRISRCIRELRQLARETKLSGYVLHHLKREADDLSETKLPPQSLLRASGEIENVVDTILFMLPRTDPVEYTAQDPQLRFACRFVIGKSRVRGARNEEVPAVYDATRQRFYEVEEEEATYPEQGDPGWEGLEQQV